MQSNCNALIPYLLQQWEMNGKQSSGGLKHAINNTKIGV